MDTNFQTMVSNHKFGLPVEEFKLKVPIDWHSKFPKRLTELTPRDTCIFKIFPLIKEVKIIDCIVFLRRQQNYIFIGNQASYIIAGNNYKLKHEGIKSLISFKEVNSYSRIHRSLTVYKDGIFFEQEFGDFLLGVSIA